MEQHSIQRTRRAPARQTQVSQDFIDQEEEYDDIWPTRMPSSARRYYSSDVSNSTGNVPSDAQAQTYREYPSTRPGRKSSIPARSTATQTNVTTTQTRRSLTQSNIPTAQASRRTPTTDVPAVQTRRTTTSSVPAVQNSRRTATTEVPAVQSSRRTTTSKVPALADSARRTTTSSMPLAQTTRRRTRDTESDIITRDGIMPVPVADNQPRKVRFHWLFYVGLAMLAMTLMWGAISAFSSWWQVTHDDWTYGRPRTYQVDQAVGHNDSDIHKSHFIALNLNRHIEVIEFPGGDPTKAKIYIGPVLMGQGQDLAPATLSFKDVNGDGKLDMIVNVQDSRFVFINDKGVFRPLHPGENVHL